MSDAARIFRGILRLPSRGVISLVRLYQLTLSPMVGGHCRYQPTCSAYFIQAVRKHGFWIGTGKGVWRILRCHPLARGGYDPVEKAGASDVGEAPKTASGKQGGGDVDDSA